MRTTGEHLVILANILSHRGTAAARMTFVVEIENAEQLDRAIRRNHLRPGRAAGLTDALTVTRAGVLDFVGLNHLRPAFVSLSEQAVIFTAHAIH